MQYSWTLSEFGELLSVYDQVPTLAMKVANQPDRNTIWMRKLCKWRIGGN
jgi:hypothetical protein